MNDKHLKRIVTGVLIYWITFVALTWLTFWYMGAIPDTLVQIGLGGGAFELLCTTIITCAKKKYEPDSKEARDDGIEFFDMSEDTSAAPEDEEAKG